MLVFSFLSDMGKVKFLELLFHFTYPEKKNRNFSSFSSCSPFHRNRKFSTSFRFFWSPFLAWLTAVEEWCKTQIRRLGVLFRGLIWIMECSLALLLIQEKKFLIPWKCRWLFQRKNGRLSLFRYFRENESQLFDYSTALVVALFLL